MRFSSDGLEDFSSAKLLPPAYLGSDEKYMVQMDGSWWMLRFGAVVESDPRRPLLGSYNNASVSEYLGCHIAQMLGLDAQETRLGTYEGRLVVACRDFVRSAEIPSELVEFSKLESGTQGVSSANRKTPDFGFTMNILANSPFLEGLHGVAMNRFWETFCLDALIGNFDRHASNWGYLASRDAMEIYSCAPVYDCGSALAPLLAEDQMTSIVESRETHLNRVLGRPKARLIVNGEQVRYKDFLLSDFGRPARDLLPEMLTKLSLPDVCRLVDDVPCISPQRKRFLKAEITISQQVILEPARGLACRERELERLTVSRSEPGPARSVLSL